MQFSKEVFGTLYLQPPTLFLETLGQEWWTLSNPSPLIEAVQLNVSGPLGVFLLRMRPQPPTGPMGGSKAPIQLALTEARSQLLKPPRSHTLFAPPTFSFSFVYC